MLVVGGRKMAKSSGNFLTLKELLAKGYDPISVRYLLMSAHYRTQLNFSEEALKDAAKSVEVLQGTLRRIRSIDPRSKNSNVELQKHLSREKRQFEKAMDDDLNTPSALAAIHRISRVANRAVDSGEVSEKDVEATYRTMSDLDTVLGILTEHEARATLPPDAERLMNERERARANRDWATADRLRDQLSAMGIVVEDTARGTEWRRKSQLSESEA